MKILAGINYNIGDITLSGRTELSRWLKIALKEQLFYLEWERTASAVAGISYFSYLCEGKASFLTTTYNSWYKTIRLALAAHVDEIVEDNQFNTSPECTAASMDIFIYWGSASAVCRTRYIWFMRGEVYCIYDTILFNKTIWLFIDRMCLNENLKKNTER